MATNRSTRSRRTTTRRPASVAPAAAAPVAREAGSVETLDWQTEYTYVMRDLRQLGVVSAVIFTLLLIVGWLT